MPIPIIDPSQATTNERLTRLEAIAEEHKQGLISLEKRMDKRMDNIEDRIARVEDHMQKSFRWLIGILFTILLAILGATVTILLNLPK